MRILLVSQMYPGRRTRRTLGTFVADLEAGLAERGHELARAVVDRRGGRSRHLVLARDVVGTARRFRPDVVYAHFLVPAGLLATLAGTGPGGADRARPGRRERRPLARSYARRPVLPCGVRRRGRRGLGLAARAARGQRSRRHAGGSTVIDCGVDLDRFAPGDATDGPRRARLDSRRERRSSARLADRAEERASASPARSRATARGRSRSSATARSASALVGRPGVRSSVPCPTTAMPRWLAAADVVCQPSLVEPFGLATLEAMACGRSVVATRVGGPPEFVPPEAGVLVDPRDEEALAAALAAAAALPRPNVAARAAAEPHDLRRQVERIEALLERAAAGASAAASAPGRAS